MISVCPVSVIIPTLNEQELLPQLLCQLELQPAEIIVSDGGSNDASTEIARELGAKIVDGPCGRGAQQNRGAALATGKVLWFVHADATIHENSVQKIIEATKNEDAIGGNFSLRFRPKIRGTNLIERIAAFQKRFGVFYGDSGIFVRRDIFEELGGFRDWPLFEDYDFARRLVSRAKRDGTKIANLSLPITLSSRRIAKSPAKTVSQWLILQLLFSAGASPHRLAKLYQR